MTFRKSCVWLKDFRFGFDSFGWALAAFMMHMLCCWCGLFKMTSLVSWREPSFASKKIFMIIHQSWLRCLVSWDGNSRRGKSMPEKCCHHLYDMIRSSPWGVFARMRLRIMNSLLVACLVKRFGAPTPPMLDGPNTAAWADVSLKPTLFKNVWIILEYFFVVLLPLGMSLGEYT